LFSGNFPLRTIVPEPSPSDNQSLVMSKGLHGPVLRDLNELNPDKTNSDKISVPLIIIFSKRPELISLAPVMIACKPEMHALEITTGSFLK
jgi:hypothetical protein